MPWLKKELLDTESIDDIGLQIGGKTIDLTIENFFERRLKMSRDAQGSQVSDVATIAKEFRAAFVAGIENTIVRTAQYDVFTSVEKKRWKQVTMSFFLSEFTVRWSVRKHPKSFCLSSSGGIPYRDVSALPCPPQWHATLTDAKGPELNTKPSCCWNPSLK